MSPHSRLLFLLAFFLIGLPLASLSLIPGRYPVYIPEAMLIIFMMSMVFRCRRGDWRAIFRDEAVRKYLFFAGGFLLAALVSYATNPHGRAGLGALKSFFFFPALGGLLAIILFRAGIRWAVIVAGIAYGALLSVVSIGGALFGRGVTYDGRLRGWLDSPNQLAFLVVIPLVFVLSQLFLSGTVRRSRRETWTLSFAALLISLALFATQSFAAIGAVVATAGVTALLVAKNRVKATIFIVFAVVALILAAGLSDKGRSIFSGNERSSFASREMIWRASFDIGTDAPVFGVGPMRFQQTYLAYQRYYPPYLEWAVPHPHNLLLAFWLETGLMGALVYILVCIELFRALWRIFWKLKTEQIIMIAPLLTIFLIGLVDTPFFRFDLSFFFFSSLAMLLMADQSSMRYTLPLARSRK